MGQQIAHPLGAQPGDVAQAGAFHPLAALLAVVRHGEAMGFIAQPPQQLHPQLIRFALQGL